MHKVFHLHINASFSNRSIIKETFSKAHMRKIHLPITLILSLIVLSFLTVPALAGLESAVQSPARAADLPSITVTKSAIPTVVPETGGNVEFSFSIQNSGSVDVTISSLEDSVFGTLAGETGCQVGTPLAVGASCSFSITRWMVGNHTGPGHYNTFIAKAKDIDNNEATALDDALVTFSDVPPSIAVTKNADPTHVLETGGDVTFTFTVENKSTEPVSLLTLSDTKFGSLDGKGTCDVPQTIAGSGTYSCTYTTWLAADNLAMHTNTLVVGAMDDEGNQVLENTSATVTFDDVAPQIKITKSASPTHVPETGGNVTFTFLVENTGQEDVTLNTLSDDLFGNLNGKGTCGVARPIPIGGSYTCMYTAWLASDTRTPHTNTVTAGVTDDDNTPASASDSETVTFDNIPLSIEVQKNANLASVPASGLDVIFTFKVTNNSNEAVTITSLGDSVFGALPGDAGCQVGTLLAAGASCEFTRVERLSLNAGETHTNTFTAVVEDNDSSTATGSDGVVITYTPFNYVFLPLIKN